MKKILLIHPWNYHDENIVCHDFSQEWRNGPYSLLCLATVLKKHSIPVELLDLQPIIVASGGNPDEARHAIRLKIQNYHPDIIGISFMSYQFIEAQKIVAEIRQISAQIEITPFLIAGGIHASVEPFSTIRDIGVDAAFVGEGEGAIVRLGSGESPCTIPGIVFRNTLPDQVHFGEYTANLDSLPFPDWSLCDVNFYTFPSAAKTSLSPSRTLDIMMGRGCAYRCSFCAYSTTCALRFHSAQYLLNQIYSMLRLYDIDSVYFTDSSIANNRKLLKEFCVLMRVSGLASKIEWYANMRANQVDEELLLEMWSAGCRFLFYGFESGSQRILDAMNKQCTVEDNYSAAMLHNRLKFPYHASLIVGYPGEEESDIKQTYKFIHDVKPFRTGINWYVPLPGSDDYTKLKGQGLVCSQSPEMWRDVGQVKTAGNNFTKMNTETLKSQYNELILLINSIKHSAGEWRVNDREYAQMNSFENQLRNKWQEIPATRQDRAFSSDLLNWPDDKLLEYWEECRRQTTAPSVRGWFQDLYRDDFVGQSIADVGPGVGVDGIYFAQRGAHVTFVDIVEDNLKLLKRICTLKGITADYYFIDDFFSYNFEKKFDAFLFIGSMINAPFDFTQRQLQAMLQFLRPSGKVLMLGYPKERYVQLGARNCEEFGKLTDGERTPWCEWYDDDKIRALFGPEFKLNWSRNFGAENNEFNWFDLTKFPFSDFAGSSTNSTALYVSEYGISIPFVHVLDLDVSLGFQVSLEYPKKSLAKKFAQWKMEVDDAPIFRYIYRNTMPKRHLEFGTWLGKGTVFCLEECNATVWTINRPFGENGEYGFYPEEVDDAHQWAKRVGMCISECGYSSDSIGFIGKSYLERNLGNRVCQIYCDSREWDASNYPDGFFDSVLIDGGHEKAVVVSDTLKAIPLLRSGGIMMWHDFCAAEYQAFESTRGVMAAIAEVWGHLNRQFSRLFWIYPSMMLVGIKK
jgi:radical SAM superfamily enzyme YgiQ (UPF0313 family)/SAM-dependent methyltransferase